MKRKIWGLTLFLLGSFFSLQAQNVSSLSLGDKYVREKWDPNGTDPKKPRKLPMT